MLQTPLQAQYKLRINVRPVKYAYFIREDDTEVLTRVLRFVCTQWGGIRSLIIPVKADLSIVPLFQRLLKLHEPDAFVGYLSDLKAARSDDQDTLQRYLRTLYPHRAVTLQLGESFERMDDTAHPLSVITDEDLHEQELITHEFIGTPLDDSVLLAVFGGIYPGQEKDYAEAFPMKHRQTRIAASDFWERQFDNSPFGSVLNLTGYGIMPYRVANSIDSNHFDVIIVTGVPSLCMFWDCRATREAVQFQKDMGRRTLLLPEGLLGNEQAMRSMVSFIRARFPYPDVSTNLHIRFGAWEKDESNVLQLTLQTLDGLEKLSDGTISVSHSWSRNEPGKLEDLSGKPLKYLFAVTDSPESYLEGAGRQVALYTALEFGRNEVFFNPPQGFRNRWGGTTAMDLECDVWLRYPKEQHLAEAIKPGSWFSRYGISFRTSPSDRPHYMEFNLPTEWQTLKLFLQARGYDTRISRPGTYANALMELVGGLDYVGLLASKPAYLLLDALALKSTKKLAQRIVEGYGSGQSIQLGNDVMEAIERLVIDVEVVPELKRVPRTYDQLATSPALRAYGQVLLNQLAQLSEKQILKRGFHLECRNCGTRSWYPLQVIKETVVCPGCSYEFPLPVEYPDGSRTEIRWEYTLNTLVNRAMDQDVLPNVLALYHLSRKKSASCIVPGLELLRGDQAVGEFDFVFVSDQHLYAGECKAGAEIGDKDLETARLAASLGIQEFYFCTVKQFSEASVQHIEALKLELSSKGCSTTLALLTGEDLLGEAIT